MSYAGTAMFRFRPHFRPKSRDSVCPKADAKITHFGNYPRNVGRLTLKDIPLKQPFSPGGETALIGGLLKICSVAA